MTSALWGKGFQPAPAGDTSAPHDNGTNYRDDLGKIVGWNPENWTPPGQTFAR